MPTFLKYQELSIDMPRCSVNNNHRDSLNTQFGTTPLNCFQAHQHPFQDNSYNSHKMKSKKYQKLWQSTYKEVPSDPELDHTQQMSFLSKKKMANYVRYKIIVRLINGRRKIAMYHH